jgi:hypothetical protein
MDERRRAICQDRFHHGRVDLNNGREPAIVAFITLRMRCMGPVVRSRHSLRILSSVCQPIATAGSDFLLDSVAALTELSAPQGNDGRSRGCRPGVSRCEPKKPQDVPKRSGAFTGAKS